MASGPITSRQIEGEKVEAVIGFIFLDYKINLGSDCSHEIKRHLLLGRKAMINLYSILKSRDIILMSMVCIVKAIIFPVVMYGCGSWTIKKAEHRRIDTFVWEKTLWSPSDCWEISQSILKEINPEYSLEGVMLELKLQYFGHLMWRADSLIPVRLLRWERLKAKGEEGGRG